MTGVAVTLSPSPILQFFGNDGRPLAGGTVETKVGGVDAPTYQDSAGTILLPNPIPLNSRGEVSTAAGASAQLFLPTGTVYEFLIKDFKGNVVNDPLSITAGLTGAQIAGQLVTITNTPVLAQYVITTAETNASITPTNYAYPGPGQGNHVNARRYGFVGDGATDDTAALQKLFTVCQQGYSAWIPRSGTGQYKVSSGLTFNGTGAIIMEGESFLSAAGSGYTVLSIGTTAGTVLSDLAVGVNGNSNNLDLVVLGADGAAGHNIQRSNISWIKAWNANGIGVNIVDAFDSYFAHIEVISCGSTVANRNKWAFGLIANTDSCNQITISRLQVELSSGQAIRVDPLTLTCSLLLIHSERTTGDGTNPTHILSGDSCHFATSHGASSSNGLWTLGGANCTYERLRTPTDTVQCSSGNSASYQGNSVQGLECTNLTIPVSNNNSWLFDSCAVSGTFTYNTGSSGKAKFRWSTIANVAPQSNNSDCIFEDCNITGTWTVTGNTVVHMKGGASANFPTPQQAFLDGVAITNAYTTPFGQMIRATNCTFAAAITLQNGSVDWASDGCTFAAGLTLGTGNPGWRFGSRDRVSGGSVSAGLLAPPSGSSATYFQGDKTWNLQPTSTGIPYWVCTTGGTPGTWTAAPIL